MPNAKLRCYCCGEPLDGKPFVLVSMGTPPVDRVFVMRPECTVRLTDNMALQLLVSVVRKQ